MQPTQTLIPVTCYTFSGLSTDYKEAYYMQEGVMNGRRVTVLGDPDFKYCLPPRRVTEAALRVMQRDFEGSIERHLPNLYLLNKFFRHEAVWFNEEAVWTQRELSIRNFSITQLPDEIGFLGSLEKVYVFANQITALPESFGNLRAVRRFWFPANLLTSLPESFGNLKLLQILDFTNNLLVSLPESFGNLRALQMLHLESNRLEFLPESFGNLKALEYLYLAYNELTTLPESFGKLKALKHLCLGDNELTSLPSRLGDLTALKHLDLTRNYLRFLPESIGGLTLCERINLRENNLENLPDSFANCRFLKEVYLNMNSFTTVPEVLFRLPSGCKVYLQGNPLFYEAIQALLRRTRAQDYTGPRFYFSNIEPSIPLAQPLEDVLPYWDNENDYTEFLTNLGEGKKTTLALYLSRLEDTKDYQVNSQSQKDMKADTKEFLRWLSKLSRDDSVLAFVLLDEANAACGDRITQYRNDLFVMRRLSEADSMTPRSLKDLLVGLKRLELLREISKQKCKSLRAVDEIEVYLYFTTHLRESLSLPTRNQSMLYPNLSQVTKYDLEVAEKSIHALTTGNEPEIFILIESMHWRNLLEKHPWFKVASEACNKLKYEEMPRDDEAIEKNYKDLKKKEASTWNPYYVLTEKLFYKKG